MIPKVINYCWFGQGELSELNKKCINSWRKICPDYQIKRWDESNYDINQAPQFIKDAYNDKKWAFVSDYVRLEVIYKNGGVYLDTDVELLKNLDHLLNLGNGYMGFENEKYVASGLGFASVKNNNLLNEMMDVYRNLDYNTADLNSFTCPIVNTKILKSHGLKQNNTIQQINNFYILPTQYLCPKNIYTGKIKFTKNTYSIHYYNASWMNSSERIKMNFIIKVKSILPSKIVEKIRNLVRKLRNDK